jgi:hypothetical protein
LELKEAASRARAIFRGGSSSSGGGSGARSSSKGEDVTFHFQLGDAATIGQEGKAGAALATALARLHLAAPATATTPGNNLTAAATATATATATSPPLFDALWMQFAVHYVCDSERHLAGLLAGVARFSAPGARFCLSFPNPLVVAAHLGLGKDRGTETSDSDAALLVGARSLASDPVFRIEADPDFLSSQGQRGPGPEGALHTTGGNASYASRSLDDFGTAYRFSLGDDAVRDCKEFLVPLRPLLRMAETHGLRRVALVTLPAFLTACASGGNASPHLWAGVSSLRGVMKVTGPDSRACSQQEWDAISAYCVLVLEKKHTHGG